MQLVARLMDHVLRAARRAHHHRGRDLRRHRRRRGRGVPRPRAGRRRRAVPARPHLRRAAADDDHARRRERACARDRRHLRRLPGAGEGACSITTPSATACGCPASIRSTGRASWRRRSITSPPRSRSARRTARSPSRCRPAISATSMPAMSPRAWGCRSTGWWSPPTSTTSWRARFATGAYEIARRGGDHLAVDGHPGLVEFRAAAVRGLWPRRRGGARADGLAGAVAPLRRVARARSSEMRALFTADRADEEESAADHPRLDARGRLSAPIRTPRSRSRSPRRRRAIPRCRWWCCRPRIRPSFPTRSRPPAASRPALPDWLADLHRAAGARHRAAGRSGGGRTIRIVGVARGA